MELMSDLRYRLRALFRRGQVDCELDDELRDHLEREAAASRARGLAPEDAMRQARLAFGGVERVREESRDARGVRWIEIVVQDVRVALRTLAAQRAYTAIAIGSLAVGISVSAGVMSIFDGVRYRALGFPNADRVVALYDPNGSHAYARAWSVPGASVEAVIERPARLSPVVPYWRSYLPVQGNGWATSAPAVFTSPSFFSLLGVRAELGRVLTAADSAAGAPATVVISHDFWRSAFGADSGAVGATIILNHRSYEVVGVLPQSAVFPADAALWSARSAATSHFDSVRTLQAIAGLPSQVPIARADAAVRAVTERDSRLQNDGRRRQALGVAPLRDLLTESIALPLIVMGVIGVFVALIASVNFATLVLARGMRRRAEFGVRAALGASLPRLVSHMIAECVVISVVGGALGSVLAPVVVHALGVWFPAFPPAWMQVTWHLRDSLLAVAFAVGLGLCFGLEPALELARPAVGELMRGISGRSIGDRRLQTRRRSLVAWQVFLAVGPAVFLLIGLGQGMTNLGQPEAGLEQPDLVVGTAALTGNDADQLRTRSAVLLDRIQQTPGVVAASLSEAGYLSGPLELDTTLDGHPGVASFRSVAIDGVSWNRVTPAYFGTVKLQLVAGRLPSPEELRRADPVAVVSASAAEALIGRPFVGWRLRLPSTTVTVIGVVGDATETSAAPVPTVFTPQTWLNPRSPARDTAGTVQRRYATVFVRPMPGITNIVRDLYVGQRDRDTTAMLSDLEPMTARIEREGRDRHRTQAVIAVLFAGALALAAVGVYGIMAYAAATRRREIAVRVALGARSLAIAILVIREASLQSGIGLGVGLVGGVVAGRYLLARPGASPPPVPVFAIGMIVMALILTMMLSAIAPVWRSWRVDAAAVLREDG